MAGVYSYIPEGSLSLRDPFYRVVESQELPLHLGEPETPYMTQYARAIFRVPFVADTYEYRAAHVSGDPAETIRWGTSSFDCAR